MGEKKLDILTVKLKNTIKRFTKKKKIVFVCTGNTCRSAMAEQIFKNYLKEKDLLDKYYVESAGLYVTEKYDGMNVLARQALSALEIKYGRHIPTQLDIVMVTDAYRVICMEQFHKDAIVKAVGDLLHIKTMNEITGRGDIPDPYGTDFNKYIETAKRLEAMCEMILEDLELSERKEADAFIESREVKGKGRKGKKEAGMTENGNDVSDKEDEDNKRKKKKKTKKAGVTETPVIKEAKEDASDVPVPDTIITPEETIGNNSADSFVQSEDLQVSENDAQEFNGDVKETEN